MAVRTMGAAQAPRWGGTGIRRLPIWLCVVQLILAYEWLLSGLNKLLNSSFDANLPGKLQQGIKGNPYHWYGSFLQRVVLPQHTLFAPLVKWGETTVGIVLLLSALLWLLRPQSRLTTVMAWLTCLALLGAIVMALNYFFQGATALPWFDPAQAYNPAVDIGILVPLLSLALLAGTIQVLRRRRRRWAVDPDSGSLEDRHAATA